MRSSDFWEIPPGAGRGLGTPGTVVAKADVPQYGTQPALAQVVAVSLRPRDCKTFLWNSWNFLPGDAALVLITAVFGKREFTSQMGTW